jgi:hypothetical protein
LADLETERLKEEEMQRRRGKGTKNLRDEETESLREAKYL